MNHHVTYVHLADPKPELDLSYIQATLDANIFLWIADLFELFMTSKKPQQLCIAVKAMKELVRNNS